MFGFLAAFGPVGIVAAVVGTVGTVAYAALTDDDETVTRSNKSEKEEQARNHAEKERDEKVLNQIEKYTVRQVLRIKKKYDVDLSFCVNGSGTIVAVKGIAMLGLAATIANTDANHEKKISSIILPSALGKRGLGLARKLMSKRGDISIELKDMPSSSKKSDNISSLECETKDLETLVKKLEALRDEIIV